MALRLDPLGFLSRKARQGGDAARLQCPAPELPGRSAMCGIIGTMNNLNTGTFQPEEPKRTHDTFDSLSLSPLILRAVASQGYTTPTPIQAQAIPPILAGRDLLGCAQTGTGKTAAFLLPILHRLLRLPRNKVQALILTPTRELALQIYSVLCGLTRHIPLRSGVVLGGTA